MPPGTPIELLQGSALQGQALRDAGGRAVPLAQLYYVSAP